MTATPSARNASVLTSDTPEGDESILVPADQLHSLPDVRAQIDALDRQLVALLALRQSYMDAAARIKQTRTAVHDRARIEDVVAKVRAEAIAQGLSLAIAEPVWRTLIDRCIAYEFEAFDNLKPGLDK